jgi:hypothetical protein
MPTISSSSPLRTIMRSLRSLNISTIFKYIEKHTIGVLRNKYNKHIAIKVLSQIYEDYSLYYLGRNYGVADSCRISVQHKGSNIYIIDMREYNYTLKQFNRIVDSYYQNIGLDMKIYKYETSILSAYILHLRGDVLVDNKTLPLLMYLSQNDAYDLVLGDKKNTKKKRKMFNKC